MVNPFLLYNYLVKLTNDPSFTQPASFPTVVPFVILAFTCFVTSAIIATTGSPTTAYRVPVPAVDSKDEQVEVNRKEAGEGDDQAEKQKPKEEKRTPRPGPKPWTIRSKISAWFIFAGWAVDALILILILPSDGKMVIGSMMFIAASIVLTITSCDSW